MSPLADQARQLFTQALQAVQPQVLLRRVAFTPHGLEVGGVSFNPAGKLALLSVGKAGASFAQAFLSQSQRKPEKMLILVPHGTPVPPQLLPHTCFASHPVPSPTPAWEQVRALVGGLNPDDGLLVLLSGGSSALLSAPAPGLDLEVMAALTAELWTAGASIGELNTVRKHLGAFLGGRLALACPGPVLTLVLSDVPGDELSSVGSGPTVADPTTRAQAQAILDRYGLTTRYPEVVAFLQCPESETPKPGDPRLAQATAWLLGSARDALAAAAQGAESAGFRPVVLTHRLKGEARLVGKWLGQLLASVSGPTALLACGETTVWVKGQGVGGRNLELALAAAQAIAGVSHRCLLACGTDGLDGSAPAAGAVVDGQTWWRGKRLGKDPAHALANNDSWGFFQGMSEAILTGPTGTNVADVVIGLVAGPLQMPLEAPSLAHQEPLPTPAFAPCARLKR